LRAAALGKGVQTWLFYEGGGAAGPRGPLVAVLMSSQADAKLVAKDLAALEAPFMAAPPPGYGATRAEFARWLRNARNWRAVYWVEYPGP